MAQTSATASPAPVFTICPRCRHRIRFRWRSFFQADASSQFKLPLRRVFDDLTPTLPTDDQGCIDYFCPTCTAPTRIIFSAINYSKIAYRFEIYAVLVGEGTPPK